jgi:hypothetical protein
MRHRLRIVLNILGLACNIVATALAAAAIYVNQTTATTLATTTWGSNDFFKEALLAQSRYAILCVIALSFGTALQMAAELVRDQRTRSHDHAESAHRTHTPEPLPAEEGEPDHHKHRHRHHHHESD